MKTISTLILVMSCMLGFAQVNPIDFEVGGHGASWSWTCFEDGPVTPALEIVTNPDPSGINTSATVAKFTALAVGAAWAGCQSTHGSDIGTFTLSSSTATVKMMVYKSVISDVGIKFADPSGAAFPEVKVANTKINQWEELTFDVSSSIGASRDQIIIFPDFTTRTADDICYFDNITFSGVVVSGGPTVAPPTPTTPPADVISMLSNSYTNVGVDTWQTSWSAATSTYTSMQVASDNVKKYSALNYVGIETTGANLINASSMLYFHVDAWTPDIPSFKIKLVDFGADGAYGGGDDVESELTFTPTLSAWNSYDMKLSDFTALTTKSHIAQLIFSAVPAGGTVYIDNVYFSTIISSIAELELSQTKMYPNPAKNDLTVIANNNNT